MLASHQFILISCIVNSAIALVVDQLTSPSTDWLLDTCVPHISPLTSSNFTTQLLIKDLNKLLQVMALPSLFLMQVMAFFLLQLASFFYPVYFTLLISLTISSLYIILPLIIITILFLIHIASNSRIGPQIIFFLKAAATMVSTPSLQYMIHALTAIPTPTNLWHQHLGHPHSIVLTVVSKQNKTLQSSFFFCNNSAASRSHKLSFPCSHSKTTKLLQLIHYGVWGLFPTLHGYKYHVLFIDDFSRFVGYFLCLINLKHYSNILHFLNGSN